MYLPASERFFYAALRTVIYPKQTFLENNKHTVHILSLITDDVKETNVQNLNFLAEYCLPTALIRPACLFLP